MTTLKKISLYMAFLAIGIPCLGAERQTPSKKPAFAIQFSEGSRPRVITRIINRYFNSSATDSGRRNAVVYLDSDGKILKYVHGQQKLHTIQEALAWNTATVLNDNKSTIEAIINAPFRYLLRRCSDSEIYPFNSSRRTSTSSSSSVSPQSTQPQPIVYSSSNPVSVSITAEPPSSFSSCPDSRVKVQLYVTPARASATAVAPLLSPALQSASSSSSSSLLPPLPSAPFTPSTIDATHNGQDNDNVHLRRVFHSDSPPHTPIYGAGLGRAASPSMDRPDETRPSEPSSVPSPARSFPSPINLSRLPENPHASNGSGNHYVRNGLGLGGLLLVGALMPSSVWEMIKNAPTKAKEKLKALRSRLRSESHKETHSTEYPLNTLTTSAKV